MERVFGADVDYTQMTKEFGHGTAWIKPYPIMGRMERKDVSTSLIERQNLTLRNFVRRLHRKTICFSKKLENLRAALSHPLLLVQLRPHPSNPEVYAGDGGGTGGDNLARGPAASELELRSSPGSIAPLPRCVYWQSREGMKIPTLDQESRRTRSE